MEKYNDRNDNRKLRKTIESMIECNMLDRNLTTEQVKSVLTDAHEEATKLGQEPEWNVLELTKCWLRFYDNSYDEKKDYNSIINQKEKNETFE